MLHNKMEDEVNRILTSYTRYKNLEIYYSILLTFYLLNTNALLYKTSLE